jgi:hypothetical protein
MKHDPHHEQDRMAKEALSTLRELGLPGALATDIEAALRQLGATEDGRIIGFTFVTPDGKRHALRTETYERARDEAA